uniref:Uncharacterized protein n=1 Tax=Plectus sambesii TaxID=2011161 RepID=A0A914USV1_9BILA
MLKNLFMALASQLFNLLYFVYSQVMVHENYMTKMAKDKAPHMLEDYFHHNYVFNDNCEFWARFGRLNCDIFTNMHMERFHRTLKRQYLHQVCNRQIDYIICRLITKVAPDFAGQLHAFSMFI